MGSFKASLQNELMLLLYRRKTVAFVLFSALLPVILAFSYRALQPVIGFVAVSQSFPVDMLGLYTLLWIPLFILFTASDVFPGEIASRTLKLALLRPVTRLQAYAAKAGAIAVGVVALLTVLGIVTVACSLFAGSLLHAADVADVLKAYAASFVSMLALTAVFVFAAQFFKSASGSIIFAIVLYAAAKLAPFFVQGFSAFSPVSYTDWHMLWLSGTVSAGKLAQSSLFLLSSIVLFFAMGYFIFDKKEV